MLPIVAMLIGSFLGLRFKALILVPVIIALSVTTFLVGLALDESPGNVALATATAVLTLQLGYLIGALLLWTPQSRTARPTPTGQNAIF